MRVTLQKSIEDLHTLFTQVDDQQDKAEVLKCLQVLQGIKATEQKETDAALSGKMSPRVMRRAGASY